MKKLAILCLSLLMMLAACKKDNPTTTIPTPPGPSNPLNPNSTMFSSLRAAFESITPKPTTVSFDAGKGTSFYSRNGVRFIFYPHAFVTVDNKPVSGTVTVEVRDCIKGSDMILNRMLSLSDGKILLSAGSAFIRASQAGTDIKLGPFLPFEIRFPTNKGTAAADMLFFKGRTSTAVPGTDINWVPFFDSLTRIVYKGDTISIFPDSTGYINLDKFAPSDIATVAVRINGVDGIIEDKDISGYYLLDGMLSVVPLGAGGGSYSANEFKSVKMLKLKAHMVVCAIYMGELYSGMLKNITAADGASYSITLSKTTPTAFKTMVDALP